MSESLNNQYIVKAYLKNFHENREIKQIASCQFGFDKKIKKYFLSTLQEAKSIEAAKVEGQIRLKEVLSALVIYTGMRYEVESVYVSQIAGKKPFLHTVTVILSTQRYLPLSDDKLQRVGEIVYALRGISNKQSHSTDPRVEKAVNYFIKGCFLEKHPHTGCFLEESWYSEAFLNFYKALEIINNSFRQKFAKSLSKSDLGNLTEKEVQQLLTPKRLFAFTCKELGGIETTDISKIIDLRNEFSAHARLKEVNVSKEDFNSCKNLAAKTIVAYINYVRTKNSPA